jgi:enoyl-CoA hydratase/carnithine racemase
MPLLCERRGAVAVLTLSRPEARNAWCEEFQTGLIRSLPELEADPDVRCVILTGDDKGGAFSAGADLKNPHSHTMDAVAAFLKDLPNRRRAHPIPMLTGFAKPIIAAVNGYAVGIVCIVTYCCDMIVASERAEWRLPQSGLGIIPAQGGATRLALGLPLKAEEAYRIGLAQWLVSHEGAAADGSGQSRAHESSACCRPAPQRSTLPVISRPAPPERDRYRRSPDGTR